MNKQIIIPPLCQNHKSLLIHGANFSKTDSWQMLEVVASVALFQKACASAEFHKRTGGDITKTDTVGCLACFSPDAFSDIVFIASSNKKIEQLDPLIKQYGESFLSRDGKSLKLSDKSE